jgi:hypothetical protein
MGHDNVSTMEHSGFCVVVWFGIGVVGFWGSSASQLLLCLNT